MLLNRPRIHPSWNPVNCFNLSRLEPINGRGMNTFQIEWKSKALCKTYFAGGLRERQFRRIFKENHSNMEKTLCHLEKRLDYVLFRALFASSIYVARNMINNGHVLVNGQRERQRRKILNSLDCVQIIPEVAARVYRNIRHPLLPLWAHVPEYLEIDYEILSIVLVNEPAFKDIPIPFDKDTMSNFSSFYTRRF